MSWLFLFFKQYKYCLGFILLSLSCTYGQASIQKDLTSYVGVDNDRGDYLTTNCQDSPGMWLPLEKYKSWYCGSTSDVVTIRGFSRNISLYSLPECKSQGKATLYKITQIGSSNGYPSCGDDGQRIDNFYYNGEGPIQFVVLCEKYSCKQHHLGSG